MAKTGVMGNDFSVNLELKMWRIWLGRGKGGGYFRWGELCKQVPGTGRRKGCLELDCLD